MLNPFSWNRQHFIKKDKKSQRKTPLGVGGWLFARFGNEESTERDFLFCRNFGKRKGLLSASQTTSLLFWENGSSHLWDFNEFQ
jgi:hypothetical protein